MRRFTLALLLILAPLTIGAQLTKAEIQGVSEALYAGNLSIDDLKFPRDPFPDVKRMPLVQLGLSDPIRASEVLMGLHRLGKDAPLSRITSELNKTAFGGSPYGEPGPSTGPAEGLEQVPEPLRAPVGRLIGNIIEANDAIKGALAKLTLEEKRSLIESLPGWAAEEPLVKFDFVRGPPLEQAKIMALMSKVDLDGIRRAAYDLSRSVEEEIPLIRAAKVDIPQKLKLRVAGIVVVLAGRGSDLHDDKDALLTIDLGGNDRYTGRHGAGVGYAGVLIDLGGDDQYSVGDLSVGAGLLGVGIAYDLGGNDSFSGGSLTFGAGLAGVGAFVKIGGDDAYRSVALSQGYGQFGIGISLDTGGDDRYDVKLTGQGAARTFGVGWLIDRAGNDVYKASGLSLNSPLFKDVYYSNAQGFASGYREDTGGISGGVGLLTDLGGDDSYLAETYAQAASYWYSLGSLYEASGHDTYSGYHYVQSSAMHITSAYLFDLGGDDGYLTKFGASHAIGHDYGVALLLDRSGNDVVAAKDSTPGVGNANGLGIFIDSAGEDRYQGPPGVGNPARGSGSLGVFLDLGGQDVYREGFADAGIAVRDTWAVAYDVEDPFKPKQQASEQVQPPKPGALPMVTDTELDRIYAKATQWGVGTAVKEVEDNIARIIGMGMPALRKLVARKLPSANRLEQRAFVQVVQALGAEAKSLIAARIASQDDNEARNAISISMETGAAEAGPFLAAAIERKATQRIAVRAAGALKSRDAVPAMLPLAASKDAMLALAAAVALNQIGDESALTTAEALLNHSSFLVRKAAVGLISKFPVRGLAIAQTKLRDDDERRVRTGVELLAAIGTPEALKTAGELLLDPRPGVRIHALLALDRRCPEEFIAAMGSLRSDPVPLVRAVAQRVEPSK